LIWLSICFVPDSADLLTSYLAALNALGTWPEPRIVVVHPDRNPAVSGIANFGDAVFITHVGVDLPKLGSHN